MGKNTKIIFTEELAARIRFMYEELEMTTAEISKQEKCGLITLRKIFHLFNITTRPRSLKTKKYRLSMEKYWTDEKKEEFSDRLAKKKKSQEEYIGYFRKTHGNKYDYSKVKYCGCTTPIIIICPTHGEFNQSPHNHKAGNGCHECAKRHLIGGYNTVHFKRNPETKILPATFYLVKLHNNDEEFIKCGITRQSVVDRISGQTPYKYEVIETHKCTLEEAYKKEQQFIHNNVSYKYIPTIQFCGWSECFSMQVLNV